MGELQHYGVIGMKWGVRREQRRSRDKAILEARTNVHKKAMEYARSAEDFLGAEVGSKKELILRDVLKKSEKEYLTTLDKSKLKTTREKGVEAAIRLLGVSGVLTIAAIATK